MLNVKGQMVNVFGGNIPYVLILSVSRVNYINIDFHHNPNYC